MYFISDNRDRDFIIARNNFTKLIRKKYYDALREYEEKCLGEIRKTIKENLNADWEREQNEVDENPHQQELKQQQVASKYDKDPNLME